MSDDDEDDDQEEVWYDDGEEEDDLESFPEIREIEEFMVPGRRYEVQMIVRDEYEEQRERASAQRVAAAQACASTSSTVFQARNIRVQGSLASDNCSVCLSKLVEENFKLVVAGCGHVFHEDCARLIRTTKCPLCRHDTSKPLPPPSPPTRKRQRT